MAGGAIWAVPTIESFVTRAAAASGGGVTTANTTLQKSINGNSTPDPANTVLCTTGSQGNAPRGTVVFTRDPIAGTICATITPAGPSHSGRNVFILQSDATTCLGGAATAAGVFPATPTATFCAPLVAGATFFAVSLNLLGGGGTDGTTSLRVNLP